MSQRSPLSLFAGYGIEMEYMIVDRSSLSVLPVADKVMAEIAGEITSDVTIGETGWSNELVLHVIELKTNGPATSIKDLHKYFTRDIRRINEILAPMNGCIMPTAMHPWMDPETETTLWPHGDATIYNTYNRIFSCRGHGWSNLQSVHINLPFANDTEFAALHAAIRIILPILPALAASSPLKEGQLTGIKDTRLEVYRNNQIKIPSIAGRVIPEPVFTKADYEGVLLKGLYRDIAPHDPEGILQEEWLNSRGAIARFDRNAIEIRVLDIQETPLADIAIVSAIVSVLKALVHERWCSLEEQKSWAVEPLAGIFLATLREAENTMIDHTDYLAMFGVDPGTGPMTARALWQHLVDELDQAGGYPLSEHMAPLRFLLKNGSLSSRIAASVGPNPGRAEIDAVYRRLCQCAAEETIFDGRIGN